jgi:hypothetical protein
MYIGLSETGPEFRHIYTRALTFEIALTFENGPQAYTRALTFEDAPQVQGNMRKLYRTFCHPKIWKPVIFLFFFGATPTPGSTWFYFYTDVVKFSSTFLGTMVSFDTN